jgi:hypothetical protein
MQQYRTSLFPALLILLAACNQATETGGYSPFLQLHPDNPHYLMYEGEPILLVSSSEHYGAVLNLDFDYRTYLKTLHEDGMNLTRTFTGTYVEHAGSFGILHNTLAPGGTRFICPWARSDTPGYKGGGNRFDVEQWDAEYFSRLRDFVSLAREYGIMVEVSLFSSIYNDESWTYCPLYHENNINNTDSVDRRQVHTPENGNLMGYQEQVVRKIVRELEEYPNIYYEIQNEPWADNTGDHFYLNPNEPGTAGGNWRYHVQVPSAAAEEWQKIVCGWIADEESGFENRHLIAQNYTNFYYPVKEVDSLVSVMNFHYAWPQAAHLNYGYDRVISLDEDGFMGDDPGRYRRGAWNFILAGGGIYNNLDYSFFVGKEDGTGDNTAPGHGSKTYRDQLRFLREFMEGFDYINLRPDPPVIRLAPGTIAQVLADPGKEYALFLNGGTQCDLQLYLPEGKYKTAWMDPVSFEPAKTEKILAGGGAVTLSSPEYEGEIALKIQREE